MAIRPAPPEAKGVKLTDVQIAAWARTSGFATLNDIITAVAIALAESSGRIDATNANLNGTTDYGVWQINSIHADLFNRYPEWWTITNAQMAFAVFQGSGWKAWTTYNSGAYQLYMGRARAAATDASAPGATDLSAGSTVAGQDSTKNETIIPGFDSLAQSFSSFSTAVAATAAWISDPHNWERIGIVLVGGALIVGALIVVAGDKTVAVANKLPIKLPI